MGRRTPSQSDNYSILSGPPLFRPLAVQIEDGTTAYIYGAEGVPIEQILSGGTVRYLHHDQLGSIRAATSSTKRVIASYRLVIH